jgi:hypothetical protein
VQNAEEPRPAPPLPPLVDEPPPVVGVAAPPEVLVLVDGAAPPDVEVPVEPAVEVPVDAPVEAPVELVELPEVVELVVVFEVAPVAPLEVLAATWLLFVGTVNAGAPVVLVAGPPPPQADTPAASAPPASSATTERVSATRTLLPSRTGRSDSGMRLYSPRGSIRLPQVGQSFRSFCES